MSWKEIHERAVGAAKTFRKSEIELLDILMEVDAAKIFEHFNLTSSVRYCIDILRLSETQALSLIRVGRKSVEVPELKSAIENGRLSVSRAKKICSVLTPENHAEWIRKAESLPTQELERQVASVDPQAAYPDRIRFLSAELVEIRCTADQRIVALLSHARDLVSRSKGTAASMGAALERVLLEFVEKHDPVRRARRAETRLARRGESECAPMVQSKGSGEGRRTPIPRALQHAVNLRDGGQCTYEHPRFGRCENRRWVQAHHPIHVASGGAHSLGNLRTLCSSHHRMEHGARTWASVPGTPGGAWKR